MSKHHGRDSTVVRDRSVPDTGPVSVEKFPVPESSAAFGLTNTERPIPSLTLGPQREV
jgi:hypothetical protein